MEQYTVTGMSCAACSARVEKAVSAVPGVASCSVNLLTNSIQAIENAGLQDGHIKITLEEERDGEERIYAVSVDDNGPGVSDENLERLFTPNFTTKSGGTGLGLAICKSIVEKSHGTIEYSRSELGGARFTMKFRV